MTIAWTAATRLTPTSSVLRIALRRLPRGACGSLWGDAGERGRRGRPAHRPPASDRAAAAGGRRRRARCARCCDGRRRRDPLADVIARARRSRRARSCSSRPRGGPRPTRSSRSLLGCAHDDGARRYASAALLRLVLDAVRDRAPARRRRRRRRSCAAACSSPAPAPTGPLALTPTARRCCSAASRAAARRRADSPPARLRATPGDALARHLRGERAASCCCAGPAGVGRRALAAAAARAAGLVPIGGAARPAELRLLARLGLALPVVAAAARSRRSAGSARRAARRLGRRAAGAGGALRRRPARARTTASAPPAGGALAPTAERRRRRPRSLGRSRARFAFTEGDIDAVAARARDGRALGAAARSTARACGRPPGASPSTRWHGWRRSSRRPSRSTTSCSPTTAERSCASSSRTSSSQHVVLDGWGFRRRLPRGQGVAALFAGPPGHRQDDGRRGASRTSSATTSTGSTCRRSSRSTSARRRRTSPTAFDEAERAQRRAVLRRGRRAVRQAHRGQATRTTATRTSRSTTSCSGWRRSPGWSILATNRQAALDEAFLRRLRFVIRFELPERRAARASCGSARSRPRRRVGDARLGRAGRAASWPAATSRRAALAAAYLAAGRRRRHHAPRTSSTRCGASTRSSARRGRAPRSGAAVPSDRRRPLTTHACAVGARARPAPAARRDRGAARRARPFPAGPRTPVGRAVAERRARAAADAERSATVALIKGMLASFDDPLLGRRPDDRRRSSTTRPRSRACSASRRRAARRGRSRRVGAATRPAPAPEDYTMQLELDATDGLEKDGPLTLGLRHLAAAGGDRDAHAAGRHRRCSAAWPAPHRRAARRRRRDDPGRASCRCRSSSGARRGSRPCG